MTRIDLAFLASLALIVAGVAAIYWPLAFVVAGLLVLSVAVRLQHAEDATPPERRERV